MTDPTLEPPPGPWLGLPEALVRQASRRRDGAAVFGCVPLRKTALLVLNMQLAWLDDAAPFSAGPAPGLLGRINAFARVVRAGGGQVAWVRTVAGKPGTRSYWATYYDNFIEPVKRAQAVAALAPEGRLSQLHGEAEVESTDWLLEKTRFSAFMRNDDVLEHRLRAAAIENVVIVGTATNICCESTVRDAQALDFRAFMPHDLVTAPTEDGHLAGLRSVMQAFADVRPSGCLKWSDA